MSLVFTFTMNTPATQAEVEELLIARCGLAWTDCKSTLLNGGCDLSVRVPTGRSRDIKREWVHFEPDITWSCYLRKEPVGWQLGRRTVLRATIAMLEHAPGDAVLMWNGDMPYLHRAGGRVAVEPEKFSAEELASLPFSYTMAPIAELFAD
jgi:hypothetical protein